MYFFVQNKKCDCSPKELVRARAKLYGHEKKYLIQIQVLQKYPIEKRSMMKETNVGNRKKLHKHTILHQF